MTPKEKAEDLIKKMYEVHSKSASDITLYFAKQCALIAVDEMLQLCDIPYLINYYEEVKQEIEKL